MDGGQSTKNKFRREQEEALCLLHIRRKEHFYIWRKEKILTEGIFHEKCKYKGRRVGGKRLRRKRMNKNKM